MYGEPYYELDFVNYKLNYTNELHVLEIEVEDGNHVFKVVDGMLINMETNELVLAEMGVKNVVIPNGVRTITREAFYKSNVTSVEFPQTLESIKPYSFAKCESLTRIILPNSLDDLQRGAFLECCNLKDVILPKYLQTIAGSSFAYTAIEKIEIPSSVTVIGSNAFLECDALKQVELPEGLKEIHGGAFGGCEQLSQIELPDGLEYIGEVAFCFCDSLKVIILPESLKQVGKHAYASCELSILRIPEQLSFVDWEYQEGTAKANSYSRRDKTFDLNSVDTVVIAGNDYDFRYPAITDAKNVYFLSTPPEDVGQILDKDSVGNIYCSDEFEHQWTRSSVASWVRQKLTILPAAEINALVEEAVNATPEPIATPRPTPSPLPTETPWPTPIITLVATPKEEAPAENKPIDPILFVFAGVIAVVVVGIVVVSQKTKRAGLKQHRQKTRKLR
ncbi:hypothetical protein SDC9_98917 [bioreactor metagenome]|uniref:Leucine-rich repeat domain-containing protein n=1 Tax=bioreactor metagenome TaxID=1076179 RepID=A0A645AIP6_9ZZZZ